MLLSNCNNVNFVVAVVVVVVAVAAASVVNTCYDHVSRYHRG